METASCLNNLPIPKQNLLEKPSTYLKYKLTSSPPHCDRASILRNVFLSYPFFSWLKKHISSEFLVNIDNNDNNPKKPVFNPLKTNINQPWPLINLYALRCTSYLDSNVNRFKFPLFYQRYTNLTLLIISITYVT